MSSVSIILPTRNNADQIEELLSSIFSQNFEGDLDVLILDSSDDLTPQIASKYSEKFNLRIVHIEPEEYNYGGTRNYGASITSGDYIVFISTDVDIRDDFWLKKLTAPLENPLVAGVYGRQLPKEDAPPMEEFFIKYTYPECRKEYYLENKEKISEFLELSDDYFSHLKILSDESRADIISNTHMKIAGFVKSAGAAYKISGAGGGDIGIALTDSAAISDKVIKAVLNAGFHVLNFNFDQSGPYIKSRAN